MKVLGGESWEEETSGMACAYVWEGNIKMDLEEEDENLWTVIIWARVWKSGRFLRP